MQQRAFVSQHRGIGQQAWAALAGGALLLLTLVAAAVWLASVNADALGAVARTQFLRNQIGALVLAVEDAETGQRGYLLTWDDTYLEPYEQAVPRVPKLLDDLTVALPQDGDTGRLVTRLRRAATAKLDELGHTVTLARSGDRAGALALVATNQGRALMDEVREVASALAAGQETEWARLTGAIRAREQLLILLDTAGVLLAAALAWLATRAIQRTLRALRAAEAGMQRAYAVVQSTNAGLESEVARRTAELQSANDEIQRFAYIVSHDLRAPLVNIMGFTAELDAACRIMQRHAAALATAGGAVPSDLEEAVGQDMPEAIRFIRASTDKMDRLIGAILRLSREGRRLLQPERIAMDTLIRTALDSLAHQVQETGAQVEIGPLPDLVSDRLAVEQVFTNLLDNALKYRDPLRPLRLTVRGRVDEGAGGAMRIYEVEDTGRGIAERDRNRVFELFRRAGGQGVPGEGVGLAHVRALVRRLGGRIELDSAPGRGSIFRVHLPAIALASLEPAG